MKKIALFSAAFALALAASTSALAGEKKAKDLVDTAVSAGSFNTLATALKEAGLVDTLKGPGPFTVFAPTDEAFKKLPPGTLESLLEDKAKLKSVLLYHVVSGSVPSSAVVGMKSASSVEGSALPIEVAAGKVKVGAANVVKTDIKASNGVIHVIDTVLLPPAR